MPELSWLPDIPDWRARLRAFSASPGWTAAIALANARLNFATTAMLDAAVRQAFPQPPGGVTGQPVRLAVLGSATLAHLLPAIRVAGLRRGLWVDAYTNAYGQYMQELADPASALHAFQPTAVLLALDARQLTASVTAELDRTVAHAALQDATAHIRAAWDLARTAFHCPLIQQTVLPLHPPLLGNSEHRLPGSRRQFIVRLNAALREMAEQHGVDLLALDDRAAQDGLDAWHRPALWHHAKQEIAPTAAPMYGELVGRLLAARQGRTRKCLVLDLDNTLWGGVIGDDGLDGIVLGQGSPLGEAFVAFQDYARQLMRRGVILAVCSKNESANALEPFERHPEMVLRRSDIASFVANWQDKPANLRAIAGELNIGLDALVFVDDNPFERELVRQALPMVAVPELPDDPALYPWVVADGGYFEALSVTEEDRTRTVQYQGNRARDALRTSTTDLAGYLRALEMRLVWLRFNRPGLQRIVQLINRSNQFNLTTKRYAEADVLAVIADPQAFGLQLRLLDRFGDNGMIAVVIGRLQPDGAVLIDSWLMSCRVLGRQVELATLNLIVAESQRLGAQRLLGVYVPTARNGMVRDHYARLGFTPLDDRGANGSRSCLDLATFTPAATPMQVVAG